MPATQKSPARGRNAPRQSVVDFLAPAPSVVSGRPTASQFLLEMRQELRLRFYQPTSIRTYIANATSFLRWFGNAPHLATRTDVRNYLLHLVDAGASSGTVSNHLCTIRLLFDRFCNRQITLGLATPRRPGKLPKLLSKTQVVRLLQSATSLRDKLVLGLMYATGMRVSEVAKVRWEDIDFQRNQIFVQNGKGRKDRVVVLPASYRKLFTELSNANGGSGYLFPAEKPCRHISPRTIQRIMARTVKLAKIEKHVTPHSLRHAFATHSFENGHDIRRIQKLLGHVRLETTTIYVKVAKPSDSASFSSPLDKLAIKANDTPAQMTGTSNSSTFSPVGSMRIHLQQQKSSDARRVAKVTIEICNTVPAYLTGTIAKELRPGYVSLEIPPVEFWRAPLAELPPRQRARIDEPEFYAILQQHVTCSLAKLPPCP